MSFEARGEPTLGFAAYLVKRESPTDHSCMTKSQAMARIVEGNPILRTDNPEHIPIVSDADVGFRVVFIPANLLGQIACSYDINIHPVRDRTYKVVVEWAQSGSCHVNLENEVSGQWSPVSEPFEVKQNRC